MSISGSTKSNENLKEMASTNSDQSIAVNARSKLLLWCSDSLTKLPNVNIPRNDEKMDSTINNDNINYYTALNCWNCPLCGTEENKAPETQLDSIKILTCFHQFCASCADKFIVTSNPNPSLENKAYQISCPICSQVTQVSNKGTKGLMTKIMWKTLFNAFGNDLLTSNTSNNSTFETPLLPIKTELIQNENIAPRTVQHEIEGDDDESSDQSSSNMVISTLDTTATFPPPCNKHPNQKLKFICKNCHIFTCPECFMDEHLPLNHEYFSFENSSITASCLAEVGSTHNPSTLLLNALNNLYDPNSTVDLTSRTKSFVDAIKIKLVEYELILKSADKIAQKLQTQYLQAKREVGEVTMTFHNATEIRKTEILKELEITFLNKEMKISLINQKLRDFMQKSVQNIQTYDKALTLSKETMVTNSNVPSTSTVVAQVSNDDTLNKALKQFFEPGLFWLFSISPSLLANQINNYDLEFITYLPAVPNIIKSSFGHIKENNFESPMLLKMILDSWREENKLTSGDSNDIKPHNTVTGVGTKSANEDDKSSTINMNSTTYNNLASQYNVNQLMYDVIKNWQNYEKLVLTNHLKPDGQMNNGISSAIPTTLSDDLKAKLEQAKFENSVSNNFMFANLLPNPDSSYNPNKMIDLLATIENSAIPIQLLNSDPHIINPSLAGHHLFNPGLSILAKSSQNPIKRRKMIYHCKFGEFGLLESQFTEPSGVTVNAQGDIIVADTNNHRIQIFDREGRFKFQFGECGKRDGQLLYPNRVAAVRSSGDIVVTERSPTHQIQIFDKFGRFLRKFGADILQHPRGVSVDHEGRIVIVECKVMRVVIFDILTGEVVHKFGCSKHLEFPNGLAVNDKKEIFISDNRAHSVKVFDYQGNYLRQIGGPGITNYPIGVGIEYSTGRLLVADNHNNFNLTIFDQQGNLLDALESKVKHAQCFDVALLDDDSMVLASKDFRIYVYRYNNVATAPCGSGTDLEPVDKDSTTAIFSSSDINNCSTSSGISLSPNSNPENIDSQRKTATSNVTNPHQNVFQFNNDKTNINTSMNKLHLNLNPNNQGNLIFGNRNNVTYQAYNAYFNKLFEHPSLHTLSQQWQNNWLLMAQHNFHQMGPAQQQLLLQYQQQQQNLAQQHTNQNNQYHHHMHNNNLYNLANTNNHPYGVNDLNLVTNYLNNTNSQPNKGEGTVNEQSLQMRKMVNSTTGNTNNHQQQQQQQFEKICYDQAAKNASSVLSNSSSTTNNKQPHPINHLYQHLQHCGPIASTRIGQQQQQYINANYFSSNDDEDGCVPNNFASANATYGTGAGRSVKTKNGLLPEMSEAIEGPLNAFGFYQPEYWSPYDSILAYVNDSMVPDPPATKK